MNGRLYYIKSFNRRFSYFNLPHNLFPLNILQAHPAKVRIAWVFGKNGKNFIKTMLNVGKKYKTVRVVNDQIGTPTYTHDLARLLVDMIIRGNINHLTTEFFTFIRNKLSSVSVYRPNVILFRVNIKIITIKCMVTANESSCNGSKRPARI